MMALPCLNVELTSQISIAVGSLDNSTSQKKDLHTIVKVGFQGYHTIDQQGSPGTLPLCPNFEEKIFGAIPPWLDCAYPILVKWALDGLGTNNYLWDWSHRHPTSSKEGDWVTLQVVLTHSGYFCGYYAAGHLVPSCCHEPSHSVINL
jgi:hypothetical protein